MNNNKTLNLKKDFPIFENSKLVYLDSASTSQKPKVVIDAVKNFYEKENANIHRGIYALSEKATINYEEVREKVAKLINANCEEEIIFTKGTTESLNLLAYSLDLQKGDEIILTEMEHHSNLVPWQQLAKRKGVVVKYIPINKEGILDLDVFKKLLTERTKVVSVVHVSNVLGTVNPIKEIIKLAHSKGAVCIIDAAQSVGSMKVDVQELDCDFLAFSGHKILGPTGTGVLYGKKKLLARMEPFLYGGDMIREVSLGGCSWNDLPWKFEAGTPNIAGVIGLGKAIGYIIEVGVEKIEGHKLELVDYAVMELSKVEGITIYGPKVKSGVISFTVNGVPPHDMATLLDREGIAVRAGVHCAMPLVKKLGVSGTVRASFHVYNTKEDVDALIKGVEKARRVFG